MVNNLFLLFQWTASGLLFRRKARARVNARVPRGAPKVTVIFGAPHASRLLRVSRVRVYFARAFVFRRIWRLLAVYLFSVFFLVFFFIIILLFTL